MRAAQIHDGTVVNVILVEPDQIDAFAAIYAPDQLVECPDEVGPGWSYADGSFTPPPEPGTDPDQVVKDNITSAPDNLTGGPTLAEVFNVHV